MVKNMSQSPASDIKELKEFIKDNFNNFEKKFEQKFADFNTEIKVIKNDMTWIKWLFGISFSLIVLLQGTILTVIFKLD